MIYFITNQSKLFKDEEINYSSIEECIEYFKDKKYIGTDTETTGLDVHLDKLLSIQLGTKEKQFVVDLTTVPISKLKLLLEDKHKTFIFHNAKFDLKFLYKQRIIVNNIFDTFLAESILYTGYPPGVVKKNLKAVVEKYCGGYLNKTIRSEINSRGLDSAVIKYAAADVEFLEDIMTQQLISIKKNNLKKALDLDNEFVKVLAYIEYSGIYLNSTLWKKKMDEDSKNLILYRNKLNNWVIEHKLNQFIDPQLDLFSNTLDCNINWSSSKQVIPLMKYLGVDTKVKDKETGIMKDSIESSVLIHQEKVSEIIPIYLKYKSIEKVVTTYGQNWLDQINPKTNRIHSNFTQILNTGRMSCGGKNKSTSEEYLNLQNVPNDHTRECFTNQFDSTILINADFSGQEQIVFANWTMDKDILSFYDQNLGDMHSFMASKLFPELSSLSLEDIKKYHPDKRQLAKKAGFAINYGGEGITIANNLNLPIEKGNEVYTAYFKAFPGIGNYFDKCKKQALKDGYVLFNSITNRKSYIYFFDDFKKLEKELTKEFWNEYRKHKLNNSIEFNNYYRPKISKYFRFKGNIERKALNYPIQGSSSEITKLAGIYFFRYLHRNNLLFKVLISNIVHDEYLVETSKNIADKIAIKLQESMEKAGDRFCKRVKLKATPNIANYWGH